MNRVMQTIYSVNKVHNFNKKVLNFYQDLICFEIYVNQRHETFILKKLIFANFVKFWSMS